MPDREQSASQPTESLPGTPPADADRGSSSPASGPDVPTEVLSGVHGKLIAFGYLKFELTPKDTSLRYQLTPDGRTAVTGEALPEDIARRWRQHTGVEILDGIGSTEALHIFISNRAGQVTPGSTEIVAQLGYAYSLAGKHGGSLLVTTSARNRNRRRRSAGEAPCASSSWSCAARVV